MRGTPSPTRGRLDRRAAVAVAASVGVLLATVLLGLGASAVVMVLVRSSSRVTAAVVLAVLIGGGVTLVARLLVRHVTPRLAGSPYVPAPPARARRLGIVAAGVAALVVGAVSLGGSVIVWVVWVLGIAGLGSVGAVLGAPREKGTRREWRASASSPRPGPAGEDGSISSEHTGVLVIVAAVVAAVVALPLAPTVGAWGSYAVCSLFGDECERPGDSGSDEEVAHGPPDFACARASSTRGGGVSVGVVVDVERDLGYELTSLSDGTARLSYTRDDAAGVGVGGGLQADLYWGEGELTLGGSAGASAALSFAEGEEYVWSGPDAERWARQYRTLHGATEAPGDAVAGGMTGPLGDLYSAVTREANDALNAAPLVDGIDYREPERVLTHVEGGLEGEARLSAGALGGGKFGVDRHEADVSGLARRAVGYTVDQETGESTVYVEVDNRVEGEGRTGSLAASGTWSEESVVALTLDAEGQVTEGAVTTYRVDEAERDIVSAEGVTEAFGDRRHGDATMEGELTQPRVYEVTTRLDLEDGENHDLLASLGGGAALPMAGGVPGAYAGEHVLEPVHERGETVIVEYEDTDRRYGADVEASLVAEGSAGAGLYASDRVARNAYYFDGGTRAWEPWADCVE